jgi:hypothetical protein
MPSVHGPRFVGVLIGLVAGHDGRDAAGLMALANERGVKYHVRSNGAVPIRGVPWQLERVLSEHAPMTGMELACWLDVSYPAGARRRNGLDPARRCAVVPRQVDSTARSFAA